MTADTFIRSYPDRQRAIAARTAYAALLVNLGQAGHFGVYVKHLSNRAGWAVYVSPYQKGTK
jgi:hypothetical protein